MTTTATGATVRTVLDHIDGITVSGEPFASPVNEYAVLLELWSGLEFLYPQAKRLDEIAIQRVDPSGEFTGFWTANALALRDLPTRLLSCSFHWYAVSACNYVRTVGAIAFRDDHDRPKPLDYAKTIIPSLVDYRDKVGAHLAWSTKSDKDNDADRMVSSFPMLAFANDSFHVGAFTVTMTKGANTAKSALSPWSIVRTHELLRARYWPNSVLLEC